MGPRISRHSLISAIVLVTFLAHGGCHPVQKESLLAIPKPDDARYDDTIAHQKRDWDPEAVIPAPPGVEDDIRKWHDDEPVQGADTNENEELLHHGKHSSIQDHQRREKLHPDDPHGYDDHSHHHDSALKVSSVFPVDPTELETAVQRQAHHSAPAELKNGSMKREKRHSNLLADAETMLWVEEEEGRPFPEDLFNYYSKGGEGNRYGLQMLPNRIQRDTATGDWFLSELKQDRASQTSSGLDDPRADDMASQKNPRNSMDFIAHLGSQIPVHVVTKMDDPAVLSNFQSDKVVLPSEGELEAALVPELSDIIAREQSTDWEGMYKKMPKAEVGKHPPMLNRQTTLLFTLVGAFLSLVAGLTLYTCRPRYDERKARAQATKPIYDEPPPAETGGMALEDLECLLE